jgi:hypothetical protein
MMTKMLAYRGFEGDPVPKLVEIEVPEVDDGDVLVKIKSAGLTYGTSTLQKAGLLKRSPAADAGTATLTGIICAGARR